MSTETWSFKDMQAPVDRTRRFISANNKTQSCELNGGIVESRVMGMSACVPVQQPPNRLRCVVVSPMLLS
jgi:hypothetical protein